LLVIHNDNNGTLGITKQTTSEIPKRTLAGILAMLGGGEDNRISNKYLFDKRPIRVNGQRDGMGEGAPSLRRSIEQRGKLKKEGGD
jgi:hypothetical protein